VERPRVRIDDSGDARALVVDETFASFYRPGEIATHCVWDAIAAPILWLPPSRRRRILVLGLGGGSVARLARALAPRAEIVGVELDPEVVRLARAHLDLDRLEVRIEIADALAWLRDAKGRFDAILEDVFIGRGDAVHKPDWIPDPAHALARARLAKGGVFVSNTLDECKEVARELRSAFPAVVSIETEDYDNRVLVGGSAGLSGAALRKRVAASPILRESLPILSFRTLAREG
jgi:spermidine synthase